MNLSIFNNNLFEAGTEFFNQLGIQLNSNTASSLGAKELLKDHYKDKGIFKAIDEAYFLGLVDDSVFDGNTPLLNKEKISLKEAEDRITAEYNGLMVFAVWLKDSYSPTRGEIAELTRAFNRVSKSVPVVLLLKYGGLLSFAASERTKYKQAWREGEKIGKISLLKDIKIDAPHTGHLKILDDLKVAPAVTDFNALYKQWQEVFNVQLLNKKFYQELADWYFWAIQNVEFPDDAEKDKTVRNAISVIRLITRIIFVWFLKEKGLVPDSLFNKSRIDNMLNYTDKTGSTFYKAILQNLFFATLNTEMNKDKPGNRIFINRQYGITNLYRYERFFKDKEKALTLFENIPFLNGGLFECLDKNTGSTEIRIDCFSNRRDNETRLTVPDHLFFNPEGRIVDLSDVYGDKKRKSERVRGLIDILDSYKFTVDENTPIEEEIALDPELLGKVFENLLASYNPETQTTARKQTGSFYTPREIVNYMVDESIIAYLSTSLSSPPLQGGVTEGRGGFIGQPPRQTSSATPPYQGGELIETRLRHLVAYNDDLHKFTSDEVDVLIAAINTLKALDPACGSGAFPMGMLHKLVYILGKLDPDNSKWREVQRQTAIKETEEAYNIGDREEREKRLLDISEVFENNASDYGRKLYLIENCIFGVDIQPIAVQIAKLRFFVSLIVDQRINPKKENLGVRPLPNLETKFVAANTLIGIEKPAQMLLRNPEIDKKEKELKEVRERHFTARTPQTKEKYRKADERLRAEISELLKKDGFPRETTEKLAKWNPYDQNASADFFDSEWMFGIREGFDVVIGNPPYFVYQGHNKDEIEMLSKIDIYEIAKGGKLNAYKLFLVKSLFLFKEGSGILCLIFQNSFLADNSASNVRKFVLENKQIIKLDSFPERDDTKKRVFEPVKMSVCILLCKNISSQDYSFQLNIWGERWMENKISTTMSKKEIKLFDSKNYVIPSIGEADKTIFQKFYNLRNNQKAGEIIECIEGELNMTFHRHFFNQNSRNPKIIKGAQVQRYYITDDMSQGIVEYLDKKQYLKEFQRSEKSRHHLSQRIVLQGITGVDDKKRLVMALLSENLFCANSCNYVILKNTDFDVKYILGILNSSLLNWIFKKTSTNSNVNCYEIEQLCIPRSCPADITESIKSIVDQILAAKKKDPSADTSALEKQIDEMVYALYGLTPEEIAIVEGK